MSLRATDARGLPTAATAPRIAGTPAYMAPEMLRDDSALDARADIYLLRATLHEVLVGDPPHDARSLAQALTRAESADDAERRIYPSHVPHELSAICERALAHAAGERFSSADALRDALAQFLSHRASIALAIAAEARLPALETALDEGLPIAARRALYAESRFGFEHALTTWADNRRARDGRARAITAMLRIEISSKNFAPAEHLASELESPPPELSSALDALSAEQQREGAEVRRLQALARDHDARIAARPRAVLTLILNLGWAAAPIGIAELRTHGLYTVSPAQHALVVPFAYAGSVAVAALVGRRAVLHTAVNRRFLAALFLVAPFLLLDRTLVLVTGWRISDAISRDLVLLSVFSAVIALMIDLRLVVAAVTFAIGACAVAARPESAEWILGLSALAACISYYLPFEFRRNALEPRVGGS